jgi:hypothetical protein
MSRTMKSLVMMIAAVLAVTARPGLAQEKDKAKPVGVQATERVRLRGFQVVLVRADDKPSPPIEGVPPTVVKALKDVEAFLPFKGYRLLDSGLILGEGGGVTRLSGDGLIYVATVGAGCSGPQSCSATVTVTLPGETTTTTSGGGTSSASVKDPVLRGAVEFAPGEAVVVGASRISANYGLVAVLTALPKK